MTQLQQLRYDEYLAVLAESPKYRQAFDGACSEFQNKNGKQMLLDSRLYLLVFAPVLTGFVSWVLEQAVKTGKNRLYFLSRDGYQMYLIAQRLVKYNRIPVECRYLHVSRYSMRVPGYHLDLEGCLDSICVGGIDVTPLKILRRGALTEEECSNVLKELKLEKLQDKILNYRQVIQLKEQLAASSRLLQYIRKHSVEAYHNAVGYLRQEGLCRDDRFAIVDSGWVGTLQCSIRTLIRSVNPDIEVEGYYFGMYEYPETAGKERFHTYYFSAGQGLARKVCFSNSLFETIVSANEGMTMAYGMENGHYFPVPGQQKNPNAEQMTRNIEALELFLAHLEPETGSCESGEFAVKLLKRFMARPTALEYECYGKNLFSDDVFDESRKEVAAKLTRKQIRDQRFLSKLLIMSGLRKAVICESAWLEGSAFRALGAGRKLSAELRHIRFYKGFVFLRKQMAA